MKKLLRFFPSVIILLSLISNFNYAQNAASATWALTAATTNTVVSSGAVTGVNELFKGTEVNGYTGPNSSQRIRMAGTNNTWAAGLTNQIDTVYVQFAVSPNPGITFNVSSVSLGIAAASSSTFRANIYFSNSPTFTNPTMVTYTPGGTGNYLSNSTLAQLTATPNISVGAGETFYLRIYPWHEGTSTATGKYMCLQNVVISGTTTGQAIISLPTLSTTAITKVSTTTAVSGGLITADGGGSITERGVCWNKTGNPTIADGKTSDGTGTGLFTSNIAGLSTNTKYFIRAFATNSAGTAYGNQDSLTTLADLTVPTVTTNAITSIMVTTAVSGGNITAWGGTDVTGRGICWNTTGAPTIADNKTSDGTGIGTFTSSMTKLTKSTKYYVRAYAVNAQGTAYGAEINFTTQAPAPAVTKTVAKDGTGDYTTVQAAFDAVPDNYTGTYTIFVKNGTYKEKLTLSANKVNVILQGESRDNTILTYDDYAGKPGLGTSSSQSVAIDASDFLAKDITFQNTIKNDGTFANQQAVALRANGDRQIYQNCKILGYQDTYYTYGAGRIYNKDCYIEGSVDFIFGKSIAVFDNCSINCNRNNSVLTAASTDPSYKFGYVFMNCTITTNVNGFDGTPITYFYLGRPWQGAPQVVYIKCAEPANLSPAGWTTMQVNPLLYAEYNCTGPGFLPLQRTTQWGNVVRQLTDAEAAQYTIANIFAKSSGIGAEDWVPQLITAIDENKNGLNEMPSDYELIQNYPNPFNPSTVISYKLPKNGFVKVAVYDVLGKQIKTLVNEEKSAGSYQVTFDAGNMASGVYFYLIQAGNFIQTKKMVLMK